MEEISGPQENNLHAVENNTELSDDEFLDEIKENPRLAALYRKEVENRKELLGDSFDAAEMQDKIKKSIRNSIENSLEFASIDSLTGLPNRLGFERDAKRWLEIAESLNVPAVLFSIDLDGFKAVNDNFGHHAGDEVLRKFGDLLQKLIRDGDVKARISGDEFKIFVIGSEMFAYIIAQRILNEAASVFDQSRIAATIGISVSIPGDSLHEMEVRAEHALQWAKSQGKGRMGIGLAEDQKIATPENRPGLLENVFNYPMNIGRAPERNDRK